MHAYTIHAYYIALPPSQRLLGYSKEKNCVGIEQEIKMILQSKDKMYG